MLSFSEFLLEAKTRRVTKVKNGKVIRRALVKTTGRGFKIKNGRVIKEKPGEARRRRMAAIKAARKRRGKRAQIARKRKRSMLKRKRMGI